MGLIIPERTEGGTRLYHEKDAQRLRMALRLARLGLELGDVQKLAKVSEDFGTSAEAASQALPLLEELRSWMDAAVNDLEA